MIYIENLRPDDTGRWVKYERNHCVPEIGRIKSWSNEVVWVVYKCNNEWSRFQDFTGQATDPEDLNFIKKSA
jgi:hypothetical protein